MLAAWVAGCGLTACDDRGAEADGWRPPRSLAGMKITLVDTNNAPYNYGLWLKPVDGTACEAENMTRTDSRYLYSVRSDRTASLVVDGYRILSASAAIHTCKWELSLVYTSPTQGAFRGTYFEADAGFVAAIAGYFYIGDRDPGGSGGNPDKDDGGDDGSGGDDDGERIAVTESNLLGKWVLSHSKGYEIDPEFDIDESWDTDEDPVFFMLLKERHVMVTYEDGNVRNGTWSLRGDILTTEENEEEVSRVKVVFLTRKTLELETSERDGNGREYDELSTFKKVE